MAKRKTQAAVAATYDAYGVQPSRFRGTRVGVVAWFSSRKAADASRPGGSDLIIVGANRAYGDIFIEAWGL